MTNTLLIKRSTVAGVVPSSLQDGEIAINQADSKLFYKSNSSILSKTLLAEGDLFSAGKSGGQSFTGGTGAAENATLSSTSNTTKGNIFLGSASAYNESTAMLGIGTTLPTANVDIFGTGDNDLFRVSNSLVLRSQITSYGLQKWFLTNGSAEVGNIQYSTPSNMPGILFYNSSGACRTQMRLYNNTAGGLAFGATSGSGPPSDSFIILGNGNVDVVNRLGIGNLSPTASIHIKAGTSAAGNAPIKLTAGTSMTNPEAGSFEFDGANLFFTIGTTRKTVTLT